MSSRPYGVATEPAALGAADTLLRLADIGSGDYISVEEILSGLGQYGFALLILVLALPNAIPGPMIPGLPVPFAIGIVLLSIQIIQGQPQPNLPGWLRRRSIRRQSFRRFVDRAAPQLHRFERWFRPRASPFMRSRDRKRVLGLTLIAFALVLAMPIPITNGPQAFAICVLALGMFENDEKVQAVGIALGVLTTFANAAMVVIGVRLWDHIARLF